MTPTGSRVWLSVVGPAAVLLVVWVAGCDSARPIGGSGTGSGAGTSGGAGRGRTTGAAGTGSAGSVGSGGSGGGTGLAGTTGAAGSGSAGRGGSGGSGGGAGPGGTTGAAGADGASGGSAGSGGSSPAPVNLIANFEDTVAVVTMSGTPTRNGHWYAFNDDALAGADPTCLQTPAPGTPYPTSVPPSFDGPNNTRALHAQWNGCVIWGAAVGADLNEPVVDGGVYRGPRVPYDLTGYAGITFWARSSPAGDTRLRVKLPMTDETWISDGGNCDEAVVGPNRCRDDWGMAFSLPTSGSWQQITVSFSDTTSFKQEGWGAVFVWNPTHVIAIQFQSQGSEVGEPFDFWLDDIYLVK